MPRPEKRHASSYVDEETSAAIDMLASRYGKTRSKMIKLLLESAIEREELTPAELDAWRAAKALAEERKAAVPVPSIRDESLDDLKRRWRDSDTPSAAAA